MNLPDKAAILGGFPWIPSRSTRQRCEMYQSLLEEATKNRKDFLAPYYERFKTADEKERARIIEQLVKLDPSHLEEPWIMESVIGWLREHKCSDFIKNVFTSAKGSNRLTEKQRLKLIKDFFLHEEIDKICREKGMSQERAFDVLAQRQADCPNDVFPQWDRENSDQDLARSIRDRYYDYVNWRKKIRLPYPYLGYDVVTSNENHKIVIRAFNQKGEMNGDILFGDWTLTRDENDPEGTISFNGHARQK